MGAWPELRYSQAVIIFALSNLLGTWQADCQREARAKHKARQTQLDAWRRTPRVRLRYASSGTPSTKASGKSILSEYRSVDQANFAASCLILAFWRLPAASGRDRALPRAPPGGCAPEPRAAGLGPCGSRSRGAGPRRNEKLQSISLSNAATRDRNACSGRSSDGCRGERQRSAAVIAAG